MKNLIARFGKIIITIMILCVLVPSPSFAAKEKAELTSVSTWIAVLFNGAANAINKLIAVPVGYQISIEDIIFNEYAPTRIDFFESLKDGKSSELIWGSNGMPGLSSTVNDCYSLFNKIAIIFYMVVLVYMGIRIILASTGQGLSQYKTLFMHWVVGIAILFLYPFAMKYIIQINNVLVDIIAANATELSGFTRNVLPAESTDSLETIDFDENPFDR